MRKILLDTNFLLHAFKFNINILSELDRLFDEKYELIINKSIENELHTISTTKSVNKLGARFALGAIGSKALTITNNEPADSWLLNYGEEHKAIVCTDDIELKRKLKAKKVRIITIKDKSHLGFV